LLGKALIYSFPTSGWSARPWVWKPAWELGGERRILGSTTIVFVPVSARLYLIPKDGTLY